MPLLARSKDALMFGVKKILKSDHSSLDLEEQKGVALGRRRVDPNKYFFNGDKKIPLFIRT